MATQKVQKLSMNPSGKEEEQKVTFEDQKKINMFAQYNIELGDLKSKLQALNKQVSFFLLLWLLNFYFLCNQSKTDQLELLCKFLALSKNF